MSDTGTAVARARRMRGAGCAARCATSRPSRRSSSSSSSSASPSDSFPTVDNFANILNQISITAIIAVGLTFVILCAEIDLSVAAIANVTGIVVAFFTLQESYVNIANLPLPGVVAIAHRARRLLRRSASSTPSASP